MKNLRFGKTKSSRFFSGKGFYVALAISLVAVGAAVFVAMNQTMNQLTDDSTAKKNASSSNTWGFPQNVNQNQSNVPITSSQPQSSSQPSASSKNSSGSTTSKSQSQSSQITFTAPLNGTILNPFSNGELVKSKTLNEWRTHDGIDIKSELGKNVNACADGIVTEVKDDPLWGVCVTIKHSGGYTSYYCGLAKGVKVSKNQKVELNQTIGTVGDTAIIETAEEPHLHFAMKKGDQWMNPADVIKNLK